jgi:3-hydroxyacyl-CoA dehydrogenase
MTEAAVSIEVEGGIATVTLSNPPVNALSHADPAGLSEAVTRIEADPDMKRAILRGAGDSFIAGADIREFGLPPQDPALPDVVRQLDATRNPGSRPSRASHLAAGWRWRLAVPTGSRPRTRSWAFQRSTSASSPGRVARSSCPV